MRAMAEAPQARGGARTGAMAAAAAAAMVREEATVQGRRDKGARMGIQGAMAVAAVTLGVMRRAGVAAAGAYMWETSRRQ